MKFKAGFLMGSFELGDYTGGIQLRLRASRTTSRTTGRCPTALKSVPNLYQFYEKGRYGRKADIGYYN